MIYSILQFVLLFVLFNHPIHSEPIQHKIKNKKYNFAICSIIKNETKYLKEWIEFHSLIGVEHFYLYTNDNSIYLKTTLKPYIQKGRVTLIPWIDLLNAENEEEIGHWALSTQIPAYENALKFVTVKTTKWLAFLNPDEYLVPVASYTLADLLQEYDSYPAILLETDVFDGSKVNLFPRTQMLIESRDWIKPPVVNKLKTFSKFIVKPDHCEGFLWPPYQLLFKDNKQPAQLLRSEARINRYVNRDTPFIDTIKRKLYLNAKMIPKSVLQKLLNEDYAIEDDEQAIFRFVPEMRKRCSLSYD